MADMVDKTTLNKSFSDLGLNEWLVKQCNAVGMSRPTPIQYNCVPEILKVTDALWSPEIAPAVNCSDCIGCAKTGSGKTAAFALPVLQKLCEDPYGIFALVITPTRELAFQIADQFSVLGKPIGVKVVTVTGGRDMMHQGLELCNKPHIVVSTPGRLADHIDSGTDFSLKKIRYLILDEADRLLEDGFGDQLTTIFSVLPQKRQTLLFSATLTDTLKQLEDVALNKPFIWHSQAIVATVEQLDQRYVLMPADVKDAYLIHILQKYLGANEKSLVMVFTHTCKYCQILGMIMKELDFPCVVLHSMIPQRQRLASLAKFKSHQVRLLIATDVASRGLDIPCVDLIINHNVPTKPKDYVHRVGRTARAGRGGLAITLVTQFDVKLLHAVENHTNVKLTEYETSEKEVTKIVTEVAVAKREAEIKLDEQDFGEQKEINKRKKLIMEGKDPDEVAQEKKKRRQEKKKQDRKKYKQLKKKKKT